MATYPLKNISIAGDTYQIQAGHEYVSVVLAYNLEDTSTTFSGTLAEIMANNAGTWSVKSITKNGVSYDPSTTMISSLSGFKQYSGEWTVRDANGVYGGDFAQLQFNYPYFTLAIPGKTSKNAFTGMVKLEVISSTNTVSQRGILLPSGGGSGVQSVTVTQDVSSGTKIGSIDVDGVSTDLYAPSGGGGSASVLTFTNNSGTAIAFSQAQQAGTIQLRLSGTAQDYSQVKTLLQNGSVIIKDADNALSTIEYVDSSSTLIVAYFNGGTFSHFKLTHQWSGNYGVSTVS